MKCFLVFWFGFFGLVFLVFLVWFLLMIFSMDFGVLIEFFNGKEEGAVYMAK